ncbi:hypothetical protein [Hymenobacter coalescens]
MKSKISFSETSMFERYVINVLREQVIEENKTLLTGNELPKSLELVDAYAPLGIFDL